MKFIDRIARALGISRKRREFIPVIEAHRKDDGSIEINVAVRVWIYREQARWIAQGIDLDYVASGASQHEVQRKFSHGLIKTICLYTLEDGSIEEFARPAPDSIVHAFNRALLSHNKKIDPRIRRVARHVDGRTMRGELAYIAPSHGAPQAA